MKTSLCFKPVFPKLGGCPPPGGREEDARGAWSHLLKIINSEKRCQFAIFFLLRCSLPLNMFGYFVNLNICFILCNNKFLFLNRAATNTAAYLWAVNGHEGVRVHHLLQDCHVLLSGVQRGPQVTQTGGQLTLLLLATCGTKTSQRFKEKHSALSAKNYPECQLTRAWPYYSGC